MEFKKNSTSHYLPCNYQQNNRSVLFICLALKLKRNCHLGFNKLNLTWHLIKSLYLFLFISSWLMYEIGYNIIITYLHSKKGAYSKSIFQGDKIWCTSKINDAMQFSYSEHIKLKRRVLKTGHLYIHSSDLLFEYAKHVGMINIEIHVSHLVECHRSRYHFWFIFMEFNILWISAVYSDSNIICTSTK